MTVGIGRQCLSMSCFVSQSTTRFVRVDSNLIPYEDVNEESNISINLLGVIPVRQIDSFSRRGLTW